LFALLLTAGRHKTEILSSEVEDHLVLGKLGLLLFLLDLQVETLHLDYAAIDQGLHVGQSLSKRVVTHNNSHLLEALSDPVHGHEHLDIGSLVDASIDDDLFESLLVCPLVNHLVEFHVQTTIKVLLFLDLHFSFLQDDGLGSGSDELDSLTELLRVDLAALRHVTARFLLGGEDREQSEQLLVRQVVQHAREEELSHNDLVTNCFHGDLSLKEYVQILVNEVIALEDQVPVVEVLLFFIDVAR